VIRFTINTDIDRPVGDVFAYVTDPQKLPTWQTNTVSVVQEGDGPLRVGTRLRCQLPCSAGPAHLTRALSLNRP